METFIFVAILLVFCFIVFAIGYNVGYEKGANVVLAEWKAWLNKIEEE